MANVIIGTVLNIGLGYLMRALAPDSIQKTEGQRLGNSQITGAAEGAAIPRIWGKFRVGGQLIWATNFREEVVVDRTEQGGKGGPKQISEATSYKYYASFAIGLCESEGGVKLNRIFIDGNSAAALGAVYGGATVCAWYPITPSSSVAEAFTAYCKKFRHDSATGEAKYAIVQAEDELAAIGMVLGASWAGARSMTATSGPGISLMGEFAGYGYYAEIPGVVAHAVGRVMAVM